MSGGSFPFNLRLEIGFILRVQAPNVNRRFIQNEPQNVYEL
jgi:hypothetical protein